MFGWLKKFWPFNKLAAKKPLIREALFSLEGDPPPETMGPEDTARIRWLLTMASCRLLSGLKRRLKSVSFEDLKLLCRYFSCSAGEIVERAWEHIKNKKLIKQERAKNDQRKN